MLVLRLKLQIFVNGLNLIIVHVGRRSANSPVLLLYIPGKSCKLIIKERDIISTMDKAEFEEFIKEASYSAVFSSCSPGQKSYPISILKHGIWTWHLIEALSGRADGALVRDNYITDASLRDYLKHEVPRYIRRNTEIRGKQIPYAVISSSITSL